MRAKRILSVSNATLGVMKSASLAVHAIDEGLAQVRKLRRKHCIKQVDWLFRNPRLKVRVPLFW